MYKKLLKLTTLSVVSLLMLSSCDEQSVASTNIEKAKLGEKLFLDKTLSKNKTMACATCHSLDSAMIDARAKIDNHTYDVNIGASLGDDNISIGDRNAPMAAYAFEAPDFHFDNGEKIYVGGFFLDGRAHTLKDQAKGPFLNPLEMNMPNEESVIQRVKENSTYISEFKKLYGDDIFENNLKAYDALADAIATFEQSSVFKSFDSKFDRFSDGEYQLSALEEQGKKLFETKAKCVACHPIDGYHPLMSDFTYDNLGVPVNKELRALNGVKDIDKGLGKEVNDARLDGAFKVSSLRNIAVTAPYMHNGVFKDLKTVVHFYNTRDIQGINPETNKVWDTPEVPQTINQTELGDLGLSDQEEDAIVAFLKTFTDKKFEHLIK